MDEHFRVLGVRRGCQLEEVKAAYRSKALQLHPDRNPNGTEAFKRLQAAYEAVTQHYKLHGGHDGRLGGYTTGNTQGSQNSSNAAYFARGAAFNYARRNQTTTPTPTPPHRTYNATPPDDDGASGRRFTDEELFSNVRNSIPGGWQFNFSAFANGVPPPGQPNTTTTTTTTTTNNSSNNTKQGSEAQRSAELLRKWTKLQETLGAKMNDETNAGNMSYDEYRARAERERVRREAKAAAIAEREEQLRRTREAEAATAKAELEAWEHYMQEEELNAQTNRQRQTVRSETHRDALLHERRMLRRIVLQQRYIPEPADVRAMNDTDLYTLVMIYRRIAPVLQDLLNARMTRGLCSRCGQVEKWAGSGSALACHHACLCGTCSQLALECPLCGACRSKTTKASPTHAKATPPPTARPARPSVGHETNHATQLRRTSYQTPAPHSNNNHNNSVSQQDSLGSTTSSSILTSTQMPAQGTAMNEPSARQATTYRGNAHDTRSTGPTYHGAPRERDARMGEDMAGVPDSMMESERKAGYEPRRTTAMPVEMDEDDIMDEEDEYAPS